MRPEQTAGDSANDGELEHVLEWWGYVATLVWEARVVGRSIGRAEGGASQKADTCEGEDPACRDPTPNHGGVRGGLAGESRGQDSWSEQQKCGEEATKRHVSSTAEGDTPRWAKKGATYRHPIQLRGPRGRARRDVLTGSALPCGQHLLVGWHSSAIHLRTRG